jgi:putative spermidine/putrescine transport system ATP-binding protein
MALHRSVSVELRGLHKRYGAVVAVHALDLRIEPGQLLCLLGPSGCGKTTTLRAIAGLVQPDSGEILVDGRVMNQVPAHRRGFGLVAQNYALFPHMSVIENVTFGLRMRGVARAETTRRARDALAMVQLAQMENRYPRQLSGGQQQRVALARCLVVEPDVLLLDEPLGALDKKLREAMQVELKSLQQQVGITTIFVTHDQEEALTLSDRIAVMHDGELQQLGTPQEIYETPRNRFVADFIGVCNFLSCEMAGCEHSTALLRIEDTTLLSASLAPGASMPAQGTRLVLAVRPEKLIIEPPTAALGRTLPACIENVVYVGTAVHLHLRTERGARLLAYRQNSTALPAHIHPGANVQVSWEADAARLVE